MFMPVIIVTAVIALINGELWRRNPLLTIVAIPVLPIMALGWWALFDRWRRGAPAMIITPNGILLTMPLAAPWIPTEAIRDVEPIHRRLGGRKHSWLVIHSTDQARLLASLPWYVRVSVQLERGRIQIPTSNMDRSPEEIEALIRAIVLRPDESR